MNPEILFNIVNGLVFLVWLLMIVAPQWKLTQLVVSSFSVILIICLIYGAIIITNFGKINFEDFGSLKGIVDLFHNSDDWGTSGIWYHLLAFDLFVGSWIFKDAQKAAIPHWLVIPCLLTTFMLGPLGFLLYQLIKWIFFKMSNKNPAHI